MRALTLILVSAALALAGPTGFSSLKIIPGVREAGMGGTGVASALGPQAIALNPAANAGILGFAATASYAKWVLDTHHQSLFLNRGYSKLSVGFGVTSFSAGEFEYRIKPTEEPIGVFTPTDFNVYLNLARSFADIFQAGLTGRYLYSRVYDAEAAGLGLDAGVRLAPIEGLSFGASIVDFGKTMTYGRDVFWLPTRARLGASRDFGPFQRGRLTLAADGSYFVYSERLGAAIGMELAWNEAFMLRAGYDLLSEVNHLNFGLGLRAGVFCFDYSFGALSFDLGGVHRVAVGLSR